MKKHMLIALASTILFSISFSTVSAQFPGGAGMAPMTTGPKISGAAGKLFGENSAFSATSEMQFKESSGTPVAFTSRMAFDAGKSRTEVDMTSMKGMGASAAEMKAMGMDKIVTITRPDKKVMYMIYPGLQAYTEMPLQDPEATKDNSNFKVETTRLGEETVNEHPTVKNKVVVTDDEGKAHEFTVWNATDLKGFPIKTEMSERGGTVTTVYNDISLSKPEASQFEPPSDFKRYGSMMEMMQAEMMKRMGGGGMPPMGR